MIAPFNSNSFKLDDPDRQSFHIKILKTILEANGKTFCSSEASCCNVLIAKYGAQDVHIVIDNWKNLTGDDVPSFHRIFRHLY